MLDNVVPAHYFGWLPPATQDTTRAAGVAIEVLRRILLDLAAVHVEVDAVVGDLAAAEFVLTPVRVIEVPVWTEVEVRGYYR